MYKHSMEPLYVNLDVISKLEEGERISVREGRFFQLRRDGFSLPDFIQRWWSGANRHSDFRAIQDLYTTAFENLDRLHKKSDDKSKADLIMLLKRMRSSERGLHVYERTYGEDVTLCARICRLREQVRLRAFPGDLHTESKEDTPED